MTKKQLLLSTLSWGFILWLLGYVLGMIFFALVPPDMIGFYILPFGVAFTLWALLQKIKREKFLCYFRLGLIWTIMAVLLDNLFIVQLFQSADYYKPDVYLHYILTFVLPIAVGLYKKSKGQIK
jgi:hypothetical protein